MNEIIKEKPNHVLNVNHKSAYTDMDGRLIMQETFNDEEKSAAAQHQKKINHSKFRYMRPFSENQLAIQLIKYYQHKDALLNKKHTYKALNNLIGYNNLLMHYSEKIETLKKQLHETNPERLAKIETQRINDTRVVGAEIIKNGSCK